MDEKLLKKIMFNFAGSDAEKLVELFSNKKNVNEFLIAKKLNLTINQTRNVLYKLADEGLVKFIRKKDLKKGGWYIYHWSLEIKKSVNKFRERILEKIKNLDGEIAAKHDKRYYKCKNCDTEFNEEDALMQDYVCPECGEPLELKDLKSEINAIRAEVTKLQEMVKILDAEIIEIEKKEQKSKGRVAKAEKKKKDEERKKKRAEKAKTAIKKPAKSPVKLKVHSKSKKKNPVKKPAKKKTKKKRK